MFYTEASVILYGGLRDFIRRPPRFFTEVEIAPAFLVIRYSSEAVTVLKSPCNFI